MIDWFTVTAQIINFLILVALLRYFLYGRIVQAMKQREQRIASMWDEAQRAKAETQQLREAIEQEKQKLETQRDELMAAVRKEVEEQRQRMLAKLRDEVDQLEQRWLQSIRTQLDRFLLDLQRRVNEEVCSIIRRTLEELADVELEHRIVQKFLDKIDQVEPSVRTQMREALQEHDAEVVVDTAFELPQALQDQIVQVLRNRLFDGSQQVPITFRRAPELICGIAISAGSYRLAWGLDDYWSSVEAELRRAVEARTTTDAMKQTVAVSGR